MNERLPREGIEERNGGEGREEESRRRGGEAYQDGIRAKKER